MKVILFFLILLLAAMALDSMIAADKAYHAQVSPSQEATALAENMQAYRDSDPQNSPSAKIAQFALLAVGGFAVWIIALLVRRAFRGPPGR